MALSESPPSLQRRASDRDRREHDRPEVAPEANSDPTIDRRNGEFLAVLAHELRNPLSLLRSNLEILKAIGGDAPAAVRARGMMEEGVQSVTRVLDDLVDISRVTRGQVDLQRERVDIAAALRQAGVDLGLAQAKDPAVTVVLPHDPVHVDADPRRLGQIVRNVVQDAMDDADGAGRVDIRLEQQANQAVLTVRNSGAGAAAARTRAERLGPPRPRHGLRLGLQLVKHLLLLHDGTIETRRDGSEGGCERVITLPLAASDMPAATHADANPSSIAPAPLRGRRVLVVDDNDDAAESTALLLRMRGNEARTAKDGTGALAVAAEFRPEIVLLDIGLPGMDGYEVARALHRDMPQPGRVVVAVSGYGTPQNSQRSRDAGIDTHFVKPMQLDALEAFLARRSK